jgi:ABC-type multidrug transport system ATPase subunit
MSARAVTRAFGKRIVFGPLNLDAHRGERIALVGPNGSGKSTFLRCIAGTLTPSGGDVRVGGHPAGTRQARRLIGVSLSQERSFYLRLSGYANLLVFAQLRQPISRARVDVAEVVEELDIAAIAAQRVDRCSSGMVQQLALARALLGAPALLMLDEPTRSLDTAATDRLWGAIDRRPEAAVLFATHRDDDIVRCHRAVDFEAS